MSPIWVDIMGEGPSGLDADSAPPPPRWLKIPGGGGLGWGGGSGRGDEGGAEGAITAGAWGLGACRAHSNSWVCGTSVIRRSALPLF